MSTSNRIGNRVGEAGTPCPPRILVVDDNPSALYMLRRTLEAMDFEVDTADSLEEALRALPEAAYRAVLTDLRLGGDERTLGLEIVAAARAVHPQATVVVLTGFGNPAVMDQVFQLGASFYFEKPVSIERLRQAFAGAALPHPPRSVAPAEGRP